MPITIYCQLHESSLFQTLLVPCRLLSPPRPPLATCNKPTPDRVFVTQPGGHKNTRVSHHWFLRNFYFISKIQIFIDDFLFPWEQKCKLEWFRVFFAENQKLIGVSNHQDCPLFYVSGALLRRHWIGGKVSAAFNPLSERRKRKVVIHPFKEMHSCRRRKREATSER